MRIKASTGIGRLLTVLIGAGGLTGCQLLGPGCVGVALVGVRVTVVDSITGELIEGDGVTVVVTDGEYVDTVEDSRSGGYSAAYGRPGVYRVEVTAPGYTSWVRDGVEVNRDDCGAVTTEIEARMVREAAAGNLTSPAQLAPESLLQDLDESVEVGNSGLRPESLLQAVGFTALSIDGFVGSSGGGLIVEVTDGFDRKAWDNITIVVEGDPGPFVCE